MGIKTELQNILNEVNSIEPLLDDIYIKLQNVFLATSPLITFTIGGITYQGENDMTWGIWIDSDYDTDGFYREYTEAPNIASKDGHYVKYNGAIVLATDTLIANGIYTIDTGSTAEPS